LKNIDFKLSKKHIDNLKKLLKKDAEDSTYPTYISCQKDFVSNINPDMYYRKNKGKYQVTLYKPLNSVRGEDQSIDFMIGPFTFIQKISEKPDLSPFNLKNQKDILMLIDDEDFLKLLSDLKDFKKPKS